MAKKYYKPASVGSTTAGTWTIKSRGGVKKRAFEGKFQLLTEIVDVNSRNLASYVVS